MIPYNETGNHMMDEKQTERAILEYKAAIILEPSIVRNYEQLSLAYDEAGDPENALFIRSVILGLAPKDSGDYYFNLYNRALTRYETYDYFGALADMNEVISIDPKEPLAYVHRAEIEIDAELYNEALEDIEVYLKGAGEDGRGLYLRGVARIHSGIPELYEPGVLDLLSAAENGYERASETLKDL